MRHKWDVIGWNMLKCRKCGMEAKPSRVKRGVGKCLGYQREGK